MNWIVLSTLGDTFDCCPQRHEIIAYYYALTVLISWVKQTWKCSFYHLGQILSVTYQPLLILNVISVNSVDEMYEILSYMPEDLSFNCRKCFPVGCPEWEMTLKRELRNGLENVLQTLILSKCSQYIYKYAKVNNILKLTVRTLCEFHVKKVGLLQIYVCPSYV